jgi:O-antigen/teichoic acid export membrane protein
LLNFGTVVFTTRIWGAEARGTIAIFMANLALLNIVANIFTGGSVAYFFRKTEVSKLWFPAVLWIFITSSAGAAIIHWTGESDIITLFLFVVAVLSGLLTFHTSLFIGKQKIAYYNLLTLLQPLFLLVFICVFYFTIERSYLAYFYGQIASLCLVVVLAWLLNDKKQMKWDKTAVKQTFSYGFQNELSSFLQFFNYRLGFYFLGFFTSKASVGIYSIGIAVSESIWIISRSISMVQYSKLISAKKDEASRKDTIVAAKYSLYISLLCIAVALLLPESAYTLVFGQEFASVKQTLLLLSPGVLAMAASTVFGHYFSAFGQMKILILKSVAGVAVTFILCLLLVPRWGIVGACIATSATHIVSSVVIFHYFFRLKK